MKRIEIDFNQLQTYTNKLDQLNDEYSKNIFAFKNRVNGIKDNSLWGGDDTDKYLYTILTTYIDSFEKVLELYRGYVDMLRFVSASTSTLERDLSSRKMTKRGN